MYKGKVVGYPVAFKLDDAKFRVSSSGRNRVIKEKRKNVHAKVSGSTFSEISIDDFDLSLYEEVYYCPYNCTDFQIKSTGEPISESKHLIGIDNKVYVPKLRLFI